LNQGEAAAIRAYGLRNPICIVPNGTDLPSETPEPRSLENPFPAGRKVLLYLGRIHPKKNLVNLLQAWSLFQKSLTDGLEKDEWSLAIVGWDQGGHQEELRRCADELELNASVIFFGPQFGPQKAACYRYCDAFVLPSLSEGLPIVVLDAWANAKPVLMTAKCNLPDGFSFGAAMEIGAMPQNIAHGIKTLCEMSCDDRRIMGQCGRALVEQCYSWPQIARQMRDVYHWILNGGSAPTHLEFI
jgi:poly(glycerol-phosphate) alpha-glucosyltransferase